MVFLEEEAVNSNIPESVLEHVKECSAKELKEKAKKSKYKELHIYS